MTPNLIISILTEKDKLELIVLILGKTFFKSIHETFGGNLVRLFSGGAPLNQETAEFYYGLHYAFMGMGVAFSGILIILGFKK